MNPDDSKNVPRVVLLVSAVAFAAFGLAFLVAPTWIGAQVDLHLLSSTARTGVRAFYGGLELGVAAFLLACAERESWQEAGLAATALMLGGAALIRATSIVFGGPVDTIHYFLLSTEIGGTVLALWGLGSAVGITRSRVVKY